MHSISFDMPKKFNAVVAFAGAPYPIISKEKLNGKPDYLLVLAWNFFEEIKRNNKGLAKNFISIKNLEKE